GLRAGDRLFLSKPLGTGVITTAAKNDSASPDVVAAAVQSMLRLNRVAAQVAQTLGVRGATDITGFGLLGHASEMVEASGAGIALSAARLPLLPGARELAERGEFSGGMKRNRRYLDESLGARLTIDSTLSAGLVGLLTESETSGGLLLAVARERAAEVAGAFAARGETCAEIGEVLAKPEIVVRA
ncbi:MAG TPA: selenide, water dikinase SelD, partial [Methylomirabilota bacterium]|nr:selenide, water dikinase SelD [Methylomirabilota bacterium]